MSFYRYKVLSIRVIDADTIEATIDQGFRTQRREFFRLARINAPELHTTEGKNARGQLVALLSLATGTITIESVKTEKYGRWLAELYVGDVNVNDWLVHNGHAVNYP